MPIATPMSADFRAGCVVDTVAGHRHDLALGLQRVDDLQLVLRGDAGVDRRRRRHLAQPVGVKRVELGSGDRGGARFDDAEILGDALGGRRVIAGDHHDPHPGASGLGDGVGHLRARRVDDPDDADVDQVLFVALIESVGCARLVEPAVGHAQRAERLGGQFLDGGQRGCPPFGVQRHHLLTDLQRRCSAAAARRARPWPPPQRPRRPTSTRADIILRSEVNGTSAWRSNWRGAVDGALELVRGDQECRLGRVAVDLPLTVAERQLRVVGQRAAREHHARLADQRRVGQFLSAGQRAALGPVAHARSVPPRRTRCGSAGSSSRSSSACRSCPRR